MLQIFLDLPPQRALFALDILPPKSVKELFKIPRFLKEGLFLTKIVTGTINATPTVTFGDLPVGMSLSKLGSFWICLTRPDLGFSTVSVPLVSDYYYHSIYNAVGDPGGMKE